MRLHGYNIYVTVTEYLLTHQMEVTIVKTIGSIKVVSILMMNILITADE